MATAKKPTAKKTNRATKGSHTKSELKTITIKNVPDKLWTRMRQRALEENVNVAEIVTQAFGRYLDGK